MRYLFLSSSDSKTNHPDNKWFDFTVDLASTLNLTDQWECALLDIKCSPSTERDFVMFTDIIGQSNIRENTASVFRYVFSSETVFTRPYFVPISRSYISHVRIYIRDMETRDEPTEFVSEVNCTLGFRKMRHGS